jgi:hypothetical protein
MANAHARVFIRTSQPDEALILYPGYHRAGTFHHGTDMNLTLRAVLLNAVVLVGCAAVGGPGSSQPSQDPFWKRLQSLCGKAYRGQLAEGNASDDRFRQAELVMHVRQCTATEIRIPFHAGADRSRTWVLTRTTQGLRLKHDHRHEDGSEDRVTQYGGDTRDPGTAERQEFYADAHTAELIPAAAANIWTVEVAPGARFAYALRREGTDRRFRVDFDLTRPIGPPPPPWGAAP